jgi:hypothetical protein
MSNYLKIALLLCLAVLIVFAIAQRLLLNGWDIEVPAWAITVIAVLNLIERSAILAAVIYAIWKLVLALLPR